MNILNLINTASIIFCLTGCGTAQDKADAQPETMSKIQKHSIITGAAGETTPILFNGKVYIFSFGRDSVDLSNGFVKIQKYPDLSTVSTFPLPYAYGSAMNDNGTLRIFASGESNPGNSIITISSTDLVTWTQPLVIFTAPDNQTIYNTSAAKTPNGYAITYEIHEEGNAAWFYQAFLQSTDAITWSKLGTSYVRGIATSCAMLRFVDGYFYLFTTQTVGSGSSVKFITYVTRSVDMVNFEDSSIPVLVSKDDGSEGDNNSDMDSVEINGQLLIVYGVGDQVNWGAMKTATYAGSFSDFVKEFYHD
jgi:hypothetical protein